MSDGQGTTCQCYPSLSYDDAPAAIAWLCEVFGFAERLVVPGPDGTIRHSELSFKDGAVVMVNSSRPEEGRVSPLRLSATSHALSLYVADPDAHFEHATSKGVEIIQELEDSNFGSRGYMAKDLEGHQWCFADYRPGAYWTD